MSTFPFSTTLFQAQNRAVFKRIVDLADKQYQFTRRMSRHEWIAKAMLPNRSSCWDIQFSVRLKGPVDNCKNTVVNNKYFHKSITRHYLPSNDTALDVVFDELLRKRSISVWIAIFIPTDAIVCWHSTFKSCFIPISLKLLISRRCWCLHSNHRQMLTQENVHLSDSNRYVCLLYGIILAFLV